MRQSDMTLPWNYILPNVFMHQLLSLSMCFAEELEFDAVGAAKTIC